MVRIKLPHAVISLSVSAGSVVDYIHHLRPLFLSSGPNNMAEIRSRVGIIEREIGRALAELKEFSEFMDTLARKLEEDLQHDFLQWNPEEIERMKEYEEKLSTVGNSEKTGNKMFLQIIRMSDYGRKPIEGVISIPSESDEVWRAISCIKNIVMPGSKIEMYSEPDGSKIAIEFFPTESLYWAYSSLRKSLQYLSLHLELARERIQELSSLLHTSSISREKIQSQYHALNIELGLREAKGRIYNFLEGQGTFQERLAKEKNICLYV